MTVRHLPATRPERIPYSTERNVVTIQPRAALPPREFFEIVPDLLPLYDDFTRASTAYARENAAVATTVKAAAAAAQSYSAAVRKAMVDGEPTEAVVNDEPRLRAEVLAHEEMEREAKRAATDAGYRLGEAIAEHWTTLAAQLEPDLETAAAKQVKAIETLDKAREDYRRVWATRRWLTSIGILGGNVGGPNLTTRDELTRELDDALTQLRHASERLDHLKAEEALHLARRAADARADAANANGVRQDDHDGPFGHLR